MLMQIRAQVRFTYGLFWQLLQLTVVTVVQRLTVS